MLLFVVSCRRTVRFTAGYGNFKIAGSADYIIIALFGTSRKVIGIKHCEKKKEKNIFR